jgi:hypothetical protein
MSENDILHNHRRENFKSYMIYVRHQHYISILLLLNDNRYSFVCFNDIIAAIQNVHFLFVLQFCIT